MHESTLYVVLIKSLGIRSQVASAQIHCDIVIFDGRIIKFSMIDHLTIRCKLVSATSILPDAGNDDN